MLRVLLALTLYGMRERPRSQPDRAIAQGTAANLQQEELQLDVARFNSVIAIEQNKMTGAADMQ